MYMSFTSR